MAHSLEQDLWDLFENLGYNLEEENEISEQIDYIVNKYC